MNEGMKIYHVRAGFEDGVDCCDEYEILYRPDGSEVAIITEPEDRSFGRDLNAVITELNDLYARNGILTKQLAKATGGASS